MILPEPDPREAELAQRLAAFHAALRAGQEPTPLAAPSTADIDANLLAAQDVVRLLEADRRAWSGSTNSERNGYAFTDAPAAPGENTRMGRFRIIRELGRGGNGIVFLAFDPVLERQVALKVPR